MISTVSALKTFGASNKNAPEKKPLKSEPSFESAQTRSESSLKDEAVIPYYIYPAGPKKDSSQYYQKCFGDKSEIMDKFNAYGRKDVMFLFEEDGNIYTTKPAVQHNDLSFLTYKNQSYDVEFNYQDIATYNFSPEAREQSTRFANEENPFDEKLVDGFRYSVYGAQYDEIGRNINNKGSSGKITIVDKTVDETLVGAIEIFKKRLGTENLSDKEKIAHIFNFVNEVFARSPYTEDEMYNYIEKTRKSNPKKEILLGDVMNTGEGVCRHKALLAKVLGDEIDLKMKIEGGYKDYLPHAWNEVMLNNKKYLFDPMYYFLVNTNNPQEPVLSEFLGYSKKLS